MTIAASVIADVVSHARESQPLECCGVLLGTPHHISKAVRGRNLRESATRFELDPRDHIAARRMARGEGLDVVGFYHSHPHSQAYPSPTDLSESVYAEPVHLIVGFVDGAPETRLFRYVDGQALEIAAKQPTV